MTRASLAMWLPWPGLSKTGSGCGGRAFLCGCSSVTATPCTQTGLGSTVHCAPFPAAVGVEEEEEGEGEESPFGDGQHHTEPPPHLLVREGGRKEGKESTSSTTQSPSLPHGWLLCLGSHPLVGGKGN